MFGPAGGAGCTPPNPPSISANTNTSPADLTATGCGGSITWSNGSSSNPLTGVGSGTYTATCTVNNCTSGPSNSVAIGGGGGSCPTYNNPQWFHWDNASSSLWFAHYGPTGKLYAATDANPATPALTRQQLLNSGVTPTLANCFLDGSKQRIAAIQSAEIPEKITVHPNPTTGKIKIVFSLQKAENVWLNLYDTQGKSLDLRDFEGKSGRNEMEYDLQNYPSGAYFVNFQSSEKREVLKVMKVN
ncbi:MAG: T9SS type A sorting domain-containing protein [Arcicella sp.]|nr:T9SS type A sorting domain-containing protein [Arcicella sp.]